MGVGVWQSKRAYRPDNVESNIKEVILWWKKVCALKIVTCPWYRLLTQWAELVHCFLFTTDPFGSLGVSGATCLLLRHLRPPGMGYLHGKRVLHRWSASHLCSLRENSRLITTSLDASQWWFGVSSSLDEAQTEVEHMDRVHPEWAQSHCTLLLEVRWWGTCQMSDAYTHSLSKITQVLFDVWSWVLGDHPIPADVMLELGLDGNLVSGCR